MTNYIISITWGKACNYLPASVEPICWDGTAKIADGQLEHADLLRYGCVAWSQAEEIPVPLTTSLHSVSWNSETVPGAAMSLEGLRLFLTCTPDTVVTLDFSHTVCQFSLKDIMENEHLQFHAGSKYGGMPIDIFLGMDARPRLSKAAYSRILLTENRPGCLLTPEDFQNAADCYHSLHGIRIEPGSSVSTDFSIQNYGVHSSDTCTVKLQILGMLGYTDLLAEDPTQLEVTICGIRHTLDFVFTTRACMPKLEDIHVEIPWSVLAANCNRFTLSYLNGRFPLLLHRVAFGAIRPSLAGELPKLPPLPENRHFHVGTETDMLTPANGDVDLLMEQMHTEQWGDYITFRERVAHADTEMVARWAKRIKELNFIAATSDTPPENIALFEQILGDRFYGEQAHEISNLAYGWGEADPIEERKTRTLKECKESYLKRMGPHHLVGQALPQQHLDYEAGVEIIMTEIPGSNATLVLHGARGAAAAYDKPIWGVHAANHVTRAPLDQDHVRRLFILLNQCWLHGANVVQDEEVALRYNHDTVYAYSDPIPTAYREIYQKLYHYGNAIRLGTPVVRTGFLQGNYDLLIGGLQAAQWVERSKVWGAFGPETESWEFNTPEAGWKLLDSYMPGVWLYPVLQDRSKIRLFFTGSPKGQVDLVPITAPVDKLSAYPVLFLPGWNTMTTEIYENLQEYVRRGGHLILCATQCTTHDTREFLLDKKSFAFLNDGDLSELAGVRVQMSDHLIRTIQFGAETVSAEPGIIRLDTQLNGAVPIATDLDGNPVLVEHKLGQGRVWMLCVGEYWGAEALDSLREVICNRVYAESQQDLRLTGDTAEVDYYEFRDGDQTRLVLLNTDWTSAGNRKHVTVHTRKLTIPIDIQEGISKHLLIRETAAIAFDVPSAIVDDFTVTSDTIAFTLQGAGDVEVTVFTGGSNCTTLRLPMGRQWHSQKIEIPLI